MTSFLESTSFQIFPRKSTLKFQNALTGQRIDNLKLTQKTVFIIKGNANQIIRSFREFTDIGRGEADDVLRHKPEKIGTIFGMRSASC